MRSCGGDLQRGCEERKKEGLRNTKGGREGGKRRGNSETTNYVQGMSKKAEGKNQLKNFTCVGEGGPCSNDGM